jgi:diguanylate cyclase (GGDEF)-like protein/PAS domain S-box-containing protein
MATVFTKFGQLPIARKITALNFLNCLIGFFVAGSILLVIDLNSYRQLVEDDLLATASLLAHHSATIVENDNKTEADSNLESLHSQKAISSACIYHIIKPQSGSIQQIKTLASFPNKTTTCPTANPGGQYIISPGFWSNIEIYQPITVNNQIIGYVYINKSLQTLTNRLQQSLLLTILILILVLSVSYRLAGLFSRLIASPITDLGSTAETVAITKNYSLRAQKNSQDEIGNMVDSFNGMLSVIEQNHRKLRESEEKFRLISASSKAGIFQIDPNGKNLYVNKEMLAICGLEEDEFSLKRLLTIVHTNDTRMIQSKFDFMTAEHKSINIDCRLVVTEETLWVTGHVDPLTDNQGQLIGYLGTVNDISDEKDAQLQLEKLAFYDTLTGLANRRLFRNRLEHVIHNLGREENKLGLILLDLDHFKNVNDTLGHDSGDTLLTIIAERLQECVRSSDTVARLGGDEFAIILPSISGSLAISHVAEKILSTVKKTVTLHETEIHITVSLGIAMAPDDGHDAETVIKHADMALYRAKDLGRDNFYFFTNELNRQLTNHLKMVSDLRKAIRRDEFHLVFQPQINLDTHAMTGMETLIRWQPEGKPAVSPMNFIPVAEETGLIIPIGRWVIAEACKTLQKLRKQSAINNDVVMTINLSLKQFHDEQLVSFLAEKICEHHIQPENLEIELTETVLMENLDEVVATLKSIGTGYSSLSYLKRLPLDILKVDRSFVTEIPENKDDMEIAAAVIAMAHSLNYKVVAEGVETLEQLEFLKQCDCDYAQGYYFSKPLPFDDLADYCNKKFPDNNIQNSTG